MNTCNVGTSLVMASQQTRMTSTRPAQAVSSPADTGRTLSNRQDETGNDSLQRMGCTPAVLELPTPTSFPAPDQTASDHLVENVPDSSPHWQPNGELLRRQGVTAQTVSFRPSVNANNRNLTGVQEALLGTAECPDPHVQSYTSLGFSGIVAGDPAWEGAPYNPEGEEWDVGFWDATFSLYS